VVGWVRYVSGVSMLIGLMDFLRRINLLGIS
jgi:hypothetical protein